MPRIQSVVGLMTTSFVIPIVLLSIFPHQESRFIIPTLLPLVFLYAPDMTQTSGVDTVSQVRKNNAYPNVFIAKNGFSKLQAIWFVCNIVLTIFYGFAHQGGVLALTSHVATELKAKPDLTHVHLFTSHTYSVPTALLHLRNTKRTYVSSGNHKYKLTKDFYLYEQGSKPIKDVYNSIALKLRECEHKYVTRSIPYRLYYALPATDMEEFISVKNNTNLFNYHIVNRFHPHVTVEKLPFSRIINNVHHLTNLNAFPVQPIIEIMDDIANAFHQFELLLIQIQNLAPRKQKNINKL